MRALSEIQTYEELLEHLQRNQPNGDAEQPSNLNPSFSKRTCWWYFANMCLDSRRNFIALSQLRQLREAVGKDFP